MKLTKNIQVALKKQYPLVLSGTVTWIMGNNCLCHGMIKIAHQDGRVITYSLPYGGDVMIPLTKVVLYCRSEDHYPGIWAIDNGSEELEMVAFCHTSWKS